MKNVMIQEVLLKIKNISVEPLLKTIKRQYICSAIGDPEVVNVFERNKAVRITGFLDFVHRLVF
jgi:hypothetical protein